MKADHEREIKYADVLNMVTYPYRNIDSDGKFIGFDGIQEILDQYRDDYVITEEEHRYLTIRLMKERDKAKS